MNDSTLIPKSPNVLSRTTDPVQENLSVGPVVRSSLQGHQLALHRSLAIYVLPETKQSLAQIYFSAVSSVEGNDECKLQTSAHFMRELLEKIQDAINQPLAAKQPPGLKSLVQQLQQKWQSLLLKPLWQDRTWQDKSIDGHMNGFLNDFLSFSQKCEAELPSRRALKANLIKHFSASSRPVPDAVLDTIIQRWDVFHSYFTAMSHNRKTLNEGTYRDHLDHCERFLLEFLQPRTFEELDEIDALIERGEK